MPRRMCVESWERDSEQAGNICLPLSDGRTDAYEHWTSLGSSWADSGNLGLEFRVKYILEVSKTNHTHRFKTIYFASEAVNKHNLSSNLFAQEKARHFLVHPAYESFSLSAYAVRSFVPVTNFLSLFPSSICLRPLFPFLDWLSLSLSFSLFVLSFFSQIFNLSLSF